MSSDKIAEKSPAADVPMTVTNEPIPSTLSSSSLPASSSSSLLAPPDLMWVVSFSTSEEAKQGLHLNLNQAEGVVLKEIHVDRIVSREPQPFWMGYAYCEFTDNKTGDRPRSICDAECVLPGYNQALFGLPFDLVERVFEPRQTCLVRRVLRARETTVRVALRAMSELTDSLLMYVRFVFEVSK